MMGLITDRTQQNVYYRKTLSEKGFSNMTEAEKIEWLGNPLEAMSVNLFSCGPNYSGTVDLKYYSEEIVATTKVDGIYLYGVSIIGDAKNYENKTFTFSMDRMESVGGGTPKIDLYWHDDRGMNYAGASLVSVGSVTFNTTDFPNVNNRAYLAAYVYVTTEPGVTVGASARFGHVMLENGAEKHDYVPYTEILPTLATKGAYNYSDLNRVERAVAEISDIAGLNLTTKTDWGVWDVPTALDMERYLGNISVVRENLTDGTSVPALPPTMDRLSYGVANNIEQILVAAYATAKAQGGT